MMVGFDAAATVSVSGIAVLAGVWVWSKDPGRRWRAWVLIRMLLRR
jgi:hypothetical protein